METIKLGSDTRKRRVDPNSDTTVHDNDPPRRLRPAGPTPPPSRPWLVPVAVVVVGLVLFGVYRLGVSRGTQNLANNDATPNAQPSTRVLLLDPVCKRAVDPANAPAVLDFGGKNIYFDSLECLNKFRNDPIAYGAGRIKVKVSQQTERDQSPPTAEPSAAASGMTADTPPDDAKLEPGGPPEPPGTDDSASAPSTGKDASLDDAPLTKAPAAPPDSGPEPSSRSVNDAPPVTETYPAQPPTDLPAKAPSVPDMGEKPVSHSRPALGTPRKTAPHKADVPKAAPPADGPDANGFSLPPEVKEGPPSRKSPGQKTGASKGTKKASSDGPPSVDESAPSSDMR